MSTGCDSFYLRISKENSGERLDKFLSQICKEYSRTYFEYLISQGAVLLNGSTVKKRTLLKECDEIEIQFLGLPNSSSLQGEDIPLKILYEDEDLLVIEKEAGMVVHPAPGHWTGTLVHALLFRYPSLPSGHLRPGIVHRLDRETSGVLVAAKTLLAQQKLVEQFASRQVYKEYLAICLNSPGSGKIRNCIGRHPVHRQHMTVVTEGGKEAISQYQTLGHSSKLSFVKFLIKTGRTHQIRVHCKALKTPILGDPLYGSAACNARYEVTRPLLHAFVLGFHHPRSQKFLTFKSMPPPDMKKWIQEITPNAIEIIKSEK